jgi:PAS domain S-box-containing protein
VTGNRRRRRDSRRVTRLESTNARLLSSNKSLRSLSQRSILRLAAVALGSNDAVVIRDLRDRVTAWNRGARLMYGFSESEALGMSLRRIMPAGREPMARDLARASARPGRKAAPIEARRRTKQGRLIDVLLTVTVLRDEKGRAVEVATTERDITALKEAERELRRLHARVISAQETERKRLARELHDGVGQILSGVKFRLQALPGQMSLGAEAEAKFVKVGGFLDHAIAEIRRVSQNLMPSELVDLGLEAALHTLGREFKERTGVRTDVRTAPTGAGPELSLAFFRIAQEALNNIGKHSRAKSVVIELVEEREELVLRVSDDGVGFSGAERPLAGRGRGLGLGNMRQRAEAVGGALALRSSPGEGTSLAARAPKRGREGAIE